ncbi:helix-turn-helix domain-containing protein [Singulisphaera acidiphila]|uniref:DNA-binding protein, excisionase family n=1 Tax=Singulisphaera acidiphila (strain ATCC BAA-1392 / DSM 18658 / VKM B-2454 / MOB10) TaxID=886293 RepID=L0DTF7_SINAD|nr:helix-turn-helix domain-containing protein [Singulisphaera acidiphila]AGA31656.1 DNA-binding protein, excisionase family [Singulisphaera acidiphila DSM 18658]
MTVKDVAKELEISLANVYALCRTGQIPHVRVGANGAGIRILRADLDAFLSSRRVGLAVKEKAARSSRKPSGPSVFKVLDTEQLRETWTAQGVIPRQPCGDSARSPIVLKHLDGEKLLAAWAAEDALDPQARENKATKSPRGERQG